MMCTLLILAAQVASPGVIGDFQVDTLKKTKDQIRKGKSGKKGKGPLKTADRKTWRIVSILRGGDGVWECALV